MKTRSTICGSLLSGIGSGHETSRLAGECCGMQLVGFTGTDVSITSVDAKHHGASLSERWNVTWVGKNSMGLTQARPKYT